MRILISWSKPVSLQVAEALREWLPLVIQQAKPWMSKADMQAGSRWGQVLGARLEATDFGIVCLTRQNLKEPWIHFESGALSKQIGTSRVIPFLFHVGFAELPGPLQQFHGVTADEAGALSLVQSVRAELPSKLLSYQALEKTFTKWWPDLKAKLDAIKVPTEEEKAPAIDQDKVLTELLLTVRDLARSREPDSATKVRSRAFAVAMGAAKPVKYHAIMMQLIPHAEVHALMMAAGCLSYDIQELAPPRAHVVMTLAAAPNLEEFRELASHHGFTVHKLYAKASENA